MEQRKTMTGNTYHQSTKYRRHEMPERGLDWSTQPDAYKEFPPSFKRIPILSVNPQGGKPLWEALGERRSFREFSHRSLNFEELSRLLWATQGITARAWGFDLRTVPSAGALYPVETYLVANRIDGIPAGIYHHSVKKGELTLLKEGQFGKELARAALGQGMLETAACVFIWTAVVERSKWKYRERAYRYIYMDAGHIGQDLYLAASGLGLGCCTVGAFFDGEVDHLIGIDGKKEVSLYLGAIGHME